MAYNFNCFVESEGLLTVTGSHLHCKSVNFCQKWCCYYRPLTGLVGWLELSSLFSTTTAISETKTT